MVDMGTYFQICMWLGKARMPQVLKCWKPCATDGSHGLVTLNNLWPIVACISEVVKAMYKKVCAETQCQGIEQVQAVLNEVCSVKNTTACHSGFSPSQWVLGQNPRGTPSFLNEETFADLGAIQDQVDPECVFHLQHAARAEARRAYVQLDSSKRV